MNNQNEQQDKRMNIQEKNLRIAQSVYPDADVIWPVNSDTSVGIHHDENEYDIYVDYYNNWNDLMPLVVEHCSWVELYEHRACVGIRKTMAPSFSEAHNGTSEGKQHALADCLLQVLEAKEKE